MQGDMLPFADGKRRSRRGEGGRPCPRGNGSAVCVTGYFGMRRGMGLMGEGGRKQSCHWHGGRRQAGCQKVVAGRLKGPRNRISGSKMNIATPMCRVPAQSKPDRRSAEPCIKQLVLYISVYSILSKTY